jgi:hypothetical protein
MFEVSRARRFNLFLLKFENVFILNYYFLCF